MVLKKKVPTNTTEDFSPEDPVEHSARILDSIVYHVLFRRNYRYTETQKYMYIFLKYIYISVYIYIYIYYLKDGVGISRI